MMGFYEANKRYINDAEDVLPQGADLSEMFCPESGISQEEYRRLLYAPGCGHLEQVARKAHELTIRNFGKVIHLYTPLYISNYCVNGCVYCNFNSSRKLDRIKLGLSEIEKEAEIIADQGFRHILILTGEDRSRSPVSYIKKAMRVLKKYFSSISLEIYPLEEEEYKGLIDHGLDGLTLYQEVYNQRIYEKVHPYGPKRDYYFRINAPERAARAGIRTVNIGALLGLNEHRYESFLTGLHAAYLQDKYPSCEISVSVPRIRPYGGTNYAAYPVSDEALVKVITALRLFLPRVGITLSTREDLELRNNLLPLGITRMSAGSDTRVGGRMSGETGQEGGGQFDISDTRDIRAVKNMLQGKGYQPVHQDWLTL